MISRLFSIGISDWDKELGFKSPNLLKLARKRGIAVVDIELQRTIGQHFEGVKNRYQKLDNKEAYVRLVW